jgi:hypothetical protein
MLIFKQLFTFLKVHCSIVDLTKRIRSKEVEYIFLLWWIQLTHYLTIFIWSAKPAKVLTTHLNVWLDGARPANTCIPPSLLGNMLVQPHGVSTPKNTFASIQNRVIQLSYLIYKKKRSTNSLWASANLSKMKYDLLPSPINSVGKMHKNKTSYFTLFITDIETCSSSLF